MPKPPNKQEQFTDDNVRRLKLPKEGDVFKKGKNKGKPKPPPGQVDYFEKVMTGRSLVLTLNSSGRKTWSVLFYRRGKPMRRKLGYFSYADAEYPKLTSKQARTKVQNYNVEEALKPKAGSFQKMSDTWFERHASKLRSQSELRRHLDSHILPEWGNWSFNSIRRGDVNELLDKIEDGHGANQADAVLATIRSIMNWHQSRDENYVTLIVRGMKRDRRKPGGIQPD